MNPVVYQAEAARTDPDRSHRLQECAIGMHRDSGVGRAETSQLFHGVIGLTGEVGELAAAVERWVYYSQNLDTTNVREEIGDCLWYLGQICRAIGYDLNSAMDDNIAKLHKRFPEKFTIDQAAEENRDRAAEREAIARKHGADSERLDLNPHSDVPYAEQTGQGWAEPAEEVITVEVDPTDPWMVARTVASWLEGREYTRAMKYVAEQEKLYCGPIGP